MKFSVEHNVIADLDLEPIKVKLMHKVSGEGWSLEKANAMEFEYRRFLSLMKLFPDEQVAPLFDVDIFWHYHILDTMKYADDCQQIFGYFLHHFPYTGLRGDDDVALHHRLGARMQHLYEATFGEPYIRHDGRHAVTAWSNPVSGKIAFSQPTMPNTAFSQPTTAVTGFSIGTQTAFSQPTKPNPAWTSGATPNKQLYARPVLAGSA